MKVTVVGLGNSGMASALLLYEKGAVVSVTDASDTEQVRRNAKPLEERYIEVELGQHSEAFLYDTELLVVSPGVEKSSVPIRYANENDIPVIGELELGYLFCKGAIAAITGTNGKSTVVSLTGDMLRQANIPVNVCGNIGNSLSGEINNIGKDTVAVVEASSFQLEWIESFKPKVSVILNVAEDHLDRYSDFEDYLYAKKRIFEKQGEGDFTVLNYDDARTKGLAESTNAASKLLYFSAKKKVEGIYLDKGDVKLFLNNKTKKLFTLRESGLKGGHNVENILAAALTATLLGAKRYPVEAAVTGFRPLAHRFEKVATIDNVDFIDDSKATNIHSTHMALRSLERPTVLIAGGRDKGLPYEKVLPDLKRNVKRVVLIGETRAKMKRIFGDSIAVEERDTLKEAVEAAYTCASSLGRRTGGSAVLLSPMCSSFDMFHDYKERGEAFKQAVGNLKRYAVR